MQLYYTFYSIALAESAMERIPLHSWEMEFSIQYHVTINSQLNYQNSIRYYIICTVCVDDFPNKKNSPKMKREYPPSPSSSSIWEKCSLYIPCQIIVILHTTLYCIPLRTIGYTIFEIISWPACAVWSPFMHCRMGICVRFRHLSEHVIVR